MKLFIGAINKGISRTPLGSNRADSYSVKSLEVIQSELESGKLNLCDRHFCFDKVKIVYAKKKRLNRPKCFYKVITGHMCTIYVNGFNKLNKTVPFSFRQFSCII